MSNKIKFSFQGVKGAYSELAGKNLYPNSISIPCKTFEEMFESVRKKDADVALVPIENSTQGSVKETVENLVTTNLLINGEINLKVSHCLMSSSKNKKSIMKVYAHEQ